MTLQPFNYIPADTLQTAETLLREHGEKAAVIAGAPICSARSRTRFTMIRRSC